MKVLGYDVDYGPGSEVIEVSVDMLVGTDTARRAEVRFSVDYGTARVKPVETVTDSTFSLGLEAEAVIAAEEYVEEEVDVVEGVLPLSEFMADLQVEWRRAE